MTGGSHGSSRRRPNCQHPDYCWRHLSSVGLFGRVGGFIGSIFGNIEAGKNSRVLAGVFGVFLILGGGWMHQLGDKSAAKSSSTVATSVTLPAGPTSPPPASTAAVLTTKTPAPATAPAIVPQPPAPTPTNAVRTSTKPAPSHNAQIAQPAPVTQAADTSKLPTTPTPEFDERLLGTWENLTPRSNSLKRLEISQSEEGLKVHVWYSCPSGDCSIGSFPVRVSQGVPTYDYADAYRQWKTSLNMFRQHMLLASVDISRPSSSKRHNIWVFAKSTMPDEMRGNLARYLGSPTPKAFAASPGGPWAFSGGVSTEDARQAALRSCERHNGQGCRIILVNCDPAE